MAAINVSGDIYSSVGTAVSAFVKIFNFHTVSIQWNAVVLVLKDCHSNNGLFEVFSMITIKTCVSSV
jgi:hypothetical protein